MLDSPLADSVTLYDWFCWLCCISPLETECNMLYLISVLDIRCSQYKTSQSQTFLPSLPSVLFASWSLGLLSQDPVTEEQPAGPGHGITKYVWASKGSGCGCVYCEVKIFMSNHGSSQECMASSGHNRCSPYWLDIKPLCNPIKISVLYSWPSWLCLWEWMFKESRVCGVPQNYGLCSVAF